MDNNIYALIIIAVVIVVAIVSRLYSATIKGFLGEMNINIRLKLLGSQFILIPNLLLDNGNGNTSQIDHVVLSEYGIFVIETKNYKGWIFGNEKSDNWLQVIFKERNYFRNPIKQNLSHIYALKNKLSEYPNIKYYPIVVFVGRAILKRLYISSPVVYANNLRKTIKQNCHVKCLTTNDLQNIKSILKSSDVSKQVSKKQHIQNIKNNMWQKTKK
jgi:hypothetical protein